EIRTEYDKLIVIELTEEEELLSWKGNTLRFLGIREAVKFTNDVLKPLNIASKVVVLPPQDRYGYKMITPKIWNQIHKKWEQE
ncbi:MAG: hypothetical protein DSZ12_00100, partial [Sulfurovum sp.]